MFRKLVSVLLALFLLLAAIPLPAAAVINLNAFIPQNLTAALIPEDQTHPYGSVTLTFSRPDLPVGEAGSEYAFEIEKRIGDGDWIGVSYVSTGTYRDLYAIGNDQYAFEQLWTEGFDWDGSTQISWRMRLTLNDATFSPVLISGWSNVASLNLKASSWAKDGIGRALGYGIVPESIQGDYTAPITRQEFAELATMLYEAYTGKDATPVSPNPFTDCSNESVLKAYGLEIVKGVTATTFKPNDLTNREQIAAMLHRAVLALDPYDADLSTDGAPSFTDDSAISPWFAQDVMFMAKNAFIQGSNGAFKPKDTCTREMAVLIAVRVYEKYAQLAP